MQTLSSHFVSVARGTSGSNEASKTAVVDPTRSFARCFEGFRFATVEVPYPHSGNSFPGHSKWLRYLNPFDTQAMLAPTVACHGANYHEEHFPSND